MVTLVDRSVVRWGDHRRSAGPLRGAGLLAPGVGGLRDYAHVCVNQWPMSSPCLPTGQCSSKTKPCKFSSVRFIYVATSGFRFLMSFRYRGHSLKSSKIAPNVVCFNPQFFFGGGEGRQNFET